MKNKGLVVQDWLARCSWKEQTVLLCGLRGPDAGANKTLKAWTRWLRSVVCKNADNSDRFMQPEPVKLFTTIDKEDANLLNNLPLHYVTHLLHAVEVVAYRHPDHMVSAQAITMYDDGCMFLHLSPEPKHAMTIRLADKNVAANYANGGFATTPEEVALEEARQRGMTDTELVAAGKDRLLDCIAARAAGGGSTICEPCSTGHPDKCLWKLPATAACEHGVNHKHHCTICFRAAHEHRTTK